MTPAIILSLIILAIFIGVLLITRKREYDERKVKGGIDLEDVLNAIPYYIGYDRVVAPPSWKDKKKHVFHFIYVDEELSGKGYADLYWICHEQGIENPRIFSPWALSMASLYHPSFYSSFRKKANHTDSRFQQFADSIDAGTPGFLVSDGLDIASIRYYLQSLVFLSGVTLSAAVIQNRWSVGTIESKLNRLWQVSHFTHQLPELKKMNLHSFVKKQAVLMQHDPVQSLIEIKYFYSAVLKILAASIPSENRCMTQKELNRAEEERFGFVDDIKALLGKNLECIILYGSAVKSETFADYDLIIVVRDTAEALAVLKGKSPMYNGLELNISVFERTDFRTYQLASGDNLADHAICLFGEIVVPHKSRNDLIARNYSFGFIRYRQLLGIAAYVGEVRSGNDDKKNLLNYFVKIPLNVAKGIVGSYGETMTNEEIKPWFIEYIDFDVEYERLLIQSGNYSEAISNATAATLSVLKFYDQKYKLHHFDKH